MKYEVQRFLEFRRTLEIEGFQVKLWSGGNEKAES